MTFRDAAGNVIQAGDLVAVGAQGLIIGKVERANAIMTDQATPPFLEVTVLFPIPAAPSGLVNGVIKIAQPSQGTTVGEA